MKKKVFFMVMVVIVFAAFLAACGTNMNGGDDRLVGSWDWEGTVWYTFETPGTGSMWPGIPIRWTTSGNTLYICDTPDSCGQRCIYPLIRGPFGFTSNDATLNFQGFTYQRR